ncbi:MAG: relaxase [Chryseobacterium sp.]|nr:relaxase [Chryseobacterium sp.]
MTGNALAKAVLSKLKLSPKIQISTNLQNWNNNVKPDIKESAKQQLKTSRTNDVDLPAQEPHSLFSLLKSTERHEDGLLPQG